MRIHIKIVPENGFFAVYRFEKFDRVLLARFKTLEGAAIFKNSIS
jgi:hypothetical protein